MQGNQSATGSTMDADDTAVMLTEIACALRQRAVLLTVGPVAAAVLGFGIASALPPTFTATSTFMPPQQAQSGAASALASLGSLASLTGGAVGMRSSGDQYVALMQSVTVADRLVEQFKLQAVYEVDFRVDARKELAKNVRIGLGKKDGLISVAVDDKDPQRAADMANQYVEELRRITASMAVTEAQQRRVFFEKQLQSSRDRLVRAQQALQASGFNAGALKAEPKAAADAYARLKAEATSAEIRLQILRGNLADGTPEVQQQQTTLGALRGQLARSERPSDNIGGPDYVSKYREFKYQETLFEMYARQFELARVDESREGALIQVLDPATRPEKKSKPNRAVLTITAALATLIALVLFTILRGIGLRKGRSLRNSSGQD